MVGKAASQSSGAAEGEGALGLPAGRDGVAGGGLRSRKEVEKSGSKEVCSDGAEVLPGD